MPQKLENKVVTDKTCVGSVIVVFYIKKCLPMNLNAEYLEFG